MAKNRPPVADGDNAAAKIQFFALKLLTMGTTEFAVSKDGDEPYEMEWADPPDPVMSASFDYLVSTGAIETVAAREARLPST